MTSGGAYAHWSSMGQLSTASYPVSGDTWDARSKCHLGGNEEPAVLTVYAIGIRPKNGAPLSQVQISQQTSPTIEIPSADVQVASGFTMVGGGAFDQWTGQGNLLTAMFPESGDHFAAAGKACEAPDYAPLTVYAVGLKPAPPTADYARFLSSVDWNMKTFVSLVTHQRVSLTERRGLSESFRSELGRFATKQAKKK